MKKSNADLQEQPARYFTDVSSQYIKELYEIWLTEPSADRFDGACVKITTSNYRKLVPVMKYLDNVLPPVENKRTFFRNRISPDSPDYRNYLSDLQEYATQVTIKAYDNLKDYIATGCDSYKSLKLNTLTRALTALNSTKEEAKSNFSGFSNNL